jgi:hypothetical protein
VDGRPDLAVEVISESSRRYDRMTKLAWYASIGVTEYWLVDPSARTLERLVLQGDKYLVADVLGEEATFRPESFEGLAGPYLGDEVKTSDPLDDLPRTRGYGHSVAVGPAAVVVARRAGAGLGELLAGRVRRVLGALLRELVALVRIDDAARAGAVACVRATGVRSTRIARARGVGGRDVGLGVGRRRVGGRVVVDVARVVVVLRLREIRVRRPRRGARGVAASEQREGGEHGGGACERRLGVGEEHAPRLRTRRARRGVPARAKCFTRRPAPRARAAQFCGLAGWRW